MIQTTLERLKILVLMQNVNQRQTVLYNVGTNPQQIMVSMNSTVV